MRESFIVPYVCTVLPKKILSKSPSSKDGISKDLESKHRFWGCELIQEAGILLRLPQVVMVTAQTILHRFYYRKSLKYFDAFRVSFASLFLATKIEESPKRIKEVLTVYYAMYKRRKWKVDKMEDQLLDLEGSVYCQWREWLVLVERQLLIDLGFSVYNVMEHAHKYVLYYIKILDGNTGLAQKAWGYVNDSFRIDIMTRYPAEAIACASIYLASRVLQMKLPDDPPWWLLFDVVEDDIVKIAREILDLYEWDLPEWLDPLTEINPFEDMDPPSKESVAAVADKSNSAQSQVSNDKSRKQSKWSSTHPTTDDDTRTLNTQNASAVSLKSQSRVQKSSARSKHSRRDSSRERIRRSKRSRSSKRNSSRSRSKHLDHRRKRRRSRDRS